jgi:hypothetical protein
MAGSAVNMALILAGAHLVPPPAGADTATSAGLKATMHLFEPRHFVFPLLAHAVGTLIGAFVATLLSPGRAAGPAWIVGALFFIGGCVSAFMLPAPAWFVATDLILAYAPMALLGYRLAGRVGPGRARAQPTS